MVEFPLARFIVEGRSGLSSLGLRQTRFYGLVSLMGNVAPGMMMLPQLMSGSRGFDAMKAPNQAGAGNCAIASSLILQHGSRAVPDRRRSGHGNALLAISAASAISAREKRNAQRRRERRGPAVGIGSVMDGESAPTTHAPNKAAPVNAPVAFWFHAGRAWRRVTEQQR